MGSDTNELDTREDDKIRNERRTIMSEEKRIKDLNATELMEKLETIIETWQKGDIDSEEALEQVCEIADNI